MLQTKYGKTSDMVTSHVQHIRELPVVFGKNPVSVCEFYEKLVPHSQALKTMGKLQEINSIVCPIINKLPGIRAQLIISDNNLQEWNFQRFVVNLRKWAERNPVVARDKQISFQPREQRILQRSQRQWIKNQT